MESSVLVDSGELVESNGFSATQLPGLWTMRTLKKSKGGNCKVIATWLDT